MVPPTLGSTRSSHSSRHEAVIEELVREDPSRKTTGFRRALQEAVEDQTDLSWIRIIPDAYQVSVGLAIAYEVEDTHRVDRAKLRAYGRLWAELDSIEVEFRLVIIDIRGGRLEPNLSEVYYLGTR